MRVQLRTRSNGEYDEIQKFFGVSPIYLWYSIEKKMKKSKKKNSPSYPFVKGRMRPAVVLLLVLLPALVLGRARLEPLGRTLHAGGQGTGCFDAYSAFMGPLGPSVWMSYTIIESFNRGRSPTTLFNSASRSRARGIQTAPSSRCSSD